MDYLRKPSSSCGACFADRGCEELAQRSPTAGFGHVSETETAITRRDISSSYVRNWLSVHEGRPPIEEGPPLRGRDFGPALLEDRVSSQAWVAAQDEYPVEPMTQLDAVFKRLALTPFTAEDWKNAGGTAELRDVAITFGLVAPHPRDDARWVVPELYRYAVSVARRGPA